MRAMRAVCVALVMVLASACSGGGGAGVGEPTAGGASEAAGPFTGHDKTTPAGDTRWACLDMLIRVISGPNSGRSFNGDLVARVDPETGTFAGNLVPVGTVDPETLEVQDGAESLCTVVGQINGTSVTWIVHCGGERIFGTGQLDLLAENQELRGSTAGPADEDIGIFHGRNYPPYIRTISPD